MKRMSKAREGLSERDLRLLSKVSNLYLQLSGVVDLSDLLRRMVSLSDSGGDLRRLRHYVLYLIVTSAVNSAREALGSKPTYRELAYEFDFVAFGAPDVARTTAVYHSGLVSYYTYREGGNPPELKVMGYLLRKIYETAEELRAELEGEEDTGLGSLSCDLGDELQKLKGVLREFPEGFYRDPVHTDPPWLKEAFTAYFTIKEIRDLTANKRSKADLEKVKKGVRLLLWDLYELYLLYLIIRFLVKGKFRVRREQDWDTEGWYITASRGGEHIDIFRHRGLEDSNLAEVKPVSKGVEKHRGKPDLSLVGRDWTIIFECKYSTSPSYITASRFKVMAYALEYMPKAAVLVYPGLEERKAKDEEIMETVELDELAKEKGLVGFVFRDRKGWETTVYMARIDPKAKDEENEGIIAKVLKEVIRA